MASSLPQIHRLAFKNRPQLSSSTHAGCFHCLAIFPAVQVDEWWDDDDEGIGQTAVCPRCGIDSVLLDGSGVEITKALLQELEAEYFS